MMVVIVPQLFHVKIKAWLLALMAHVLLLKLIVLNQVIVQKIAQQVLIGMDSVAMIVLIV
jgi:hypothetical protein